MIRCTPILFALVAWTSLAAAQEADSMAEAKRALQALVEAKSYAWTSEESPGVGGAPVQARCEKNKPLHVIADKLECYRQANAVVYLGDQGWARSRTGTLSDPLRILGSVAKVRSLALPHEEAAILLGAKLAAKPNSWKQDGKTMKYVFALKDETVRKLTPMQYSQVTQEGEAEIWLEARNLVRYRIQIGLRGTIGNAEIDGQYVHVVSLSQIGQTTVVPPAAAMKLLEAAP
jgi:hypothetical protein